MAVGMRKIFSHYQTVLVQNMIHFFGQKVQKKLRFRLNFRRCFFACIIKKKNFFSRESHRDMRNSTVDWRLFDPSFHMRI